MADDPRIEAAIAVARAALRDGAAWWNYSVDGMARTIAIQALGAADRHDALRALLADQDRAVELLAKESVNAYDQGAWDALAPTARQLHQDRASAVLAALREVSEGCPVAERRVTEADIRAVLAGTYTPEGIELWWYAPNRNLRYSSPAWLFEKGERARVLVEAERVAGAR